MSNSKNLNEYSEDEQSDFGPVTRKTKVNGEDLHPGTNIKGKSETPG